MGVVEIVRLLVILLLIALVVILVARRLAVPYTLGLVIVGLLISLSGHIEVHLTPDVVLFVFLPALLFEGSWAISVQALRENWRSIFLLAIPGLFLELVLIAVPLHFFTTISWEGSFLLAAILSPTDPIAVLGLFRQLKVNEQLATIIEGESLFNDGVAGALYQLFLAFVLLTVHGQNMTSGQMAWQGLGILAAEAGGGVLIGGIGGFLISRLVRHVDDHLIETTITIVAAYGIYLLADALHTSGILAVIVLGLILGSYGQTHGMSETTREAVDDFWSIIAFVANALLFLLVGIQLNPSEFLLSDHSRPLLLIAGVVVVAVLVARYVMVLLLPLGLAGLPAGVRKRIRSWRFVLFWSGLRGALSLALVLALPLEVPDRNALIFATYAVVLFTLLVQGLSLRFVLKKMPSTMALNDENDENDKKG